MADATPVAVEIDCSNIGDLAATVPGILGQAAQAAADGDVTATQQLLALAQQRADDATNAVPAETTRPLTDEELADLKERQAAALDTYKTGKTAEINAAIAATDSEVVGYLEGGTAVPQPLADYRSSLRALIDSVAAATDIATVDAIQLPDPPTTS